MIMSIRQELGASSCAGGGQGGCWNSGIDFQEQISVIIIPDLTSQLEHPL